MDIIINRWNASHFPLKAEYERRDYFLNGERSKHIIRVSKYLLDDLEGDVNLEDTKMKFLMEFQSEDSGIAAMQMMEKEFGY